MTESVAFTGEFMVEGATNARIEADHVERYRWALQMTDSEHVLDIACGTGYGSHMLARSGATSVTGVDVSPDALHIARGRYQEENLTFESGDLLSFKGRQGGYSLITCFETIEHVDDYMAALCNLRELLTPFGALLISTPNRPVTSPRATTLADKPANEFHVREFTPKELRAAILSAGFSLLPVMYGQRVQPIRLPSFPQRVFARAFRPQDRLSPVVTEVRFPRSPRYFIMQASTGRATPN